MQSSMYIYIYIYIHTHTCIYTCIYIINFANRVVASISHCVCRWRKQAVEEQQRFRQRAEAYNARIQHLETQLSVLQAQIDQQPTVPNAAVTASTHSPKHDPHSAAPGLLKDAMPEGTADAGVCMPVEDAPKRAAPEAAVRALPAGRLSPHSPTHSAAGPSRQGMGGSTGSGLEAPMGLQQSLAGDRLSPMRQGATATGSPRSPAGSTGNPHAVDMQLGPGPDGNSPPSHLARASSHRVLDGKDEIASGEKVVHADASAEAAAAAAGFSGKFGAGAAEPGRITAQLLASALAQAFAAMTSGELATQT